MTKTTEKWVLVTRSEDESFDDLLRVLKKHGRDPVRVFPIYGTMRAFLTESGLDLSPQAFLNGSYIGGVEEVKAYLRAKDQVPRDDHVLVGYALHHEEDEDFDVWKNL